MSGNSTGSFQTIAKIGGFIIALWTILLTVEQYRLSDRVFDYQQKQDSINAVRDSVHNISSSIQAEQASIEGLTGLLRNSSQNFGSLIPHISMLSNRFKEINIPQEGQLGLLRISRSRGEMLQLLCQQRLEHEAFDSLFEQVSFSMSWIVARNRQMISANYLHSIDLSKSLLMKSGFDGADIAFGNFQEVTFDDFSFVNCNLAQADFRKAKIFGGLFPVGDARKTNLTGSKWEGTQITFPNGRFTNDSVPLAEWFQGGNLIGKDEILRDYKLDKTPLSVGNDSSGIVLYRIRKKGE